MGSVTWVLASLLALVATTAARGQSLPDYLLLPGDKLEVSVWKETEMQRTVIVRPDGKFSFPLTGEVKAAGRSVEQVRSEIETKLVRYISEPVVTVALSEIVGNRVYVIGQVLKPGVFVMNPQVNVLQALSLAGGMTPFAKSDDIIVIRGDASGQRTLPFRYGQVSSGRNLEQNILLDSGDVVVVP
jgi:polysaccharide biosynthesis/export protein